jgi:hypothetical protein
MKQYKGTTTLTHLYLPLFTPSTTRSALAVRLPRRRVHGCLGDRGAFITVFLLLQVGRRRDSAGSPGENDLVLYINSRGYASAKRVLLRQLIGRFLLLRLYSRWAFINSVPVLCVVRALTSGVCFPKPECECEFYRPVAQTLPV